MKRLINALLAALLSITSSDCQSQTNNNTTSITIIVDLTDKLAVYPSAEQIVGQLGLKENPWQEIRVIITTITDKDINAINTVTLPGESKWDGNEVIRRAKINRFTKQFSQYLQTLNYKQGYPYSVAYRTIARQLNRIATENAQRKFVLVYSNLIEHTNEINFYHAQTAKLLKTDPTKVERSLLSQVQLSQLNGVQVWLLFDPETYEGNNEYMVVANLYQHMSEGKGAKTYIANSFSQP